MKIAAHYPPMRARYERHFQRSNTMANFLDCASNYISAFRVVNIFFK